MRDAFREKFGSEPDGVWSSPGRVNLVGEHTDYNGGLALPFAINRRTRIALKLRSDAQIRVESTFGDTHVLSSLTEALGTAPLTGWSAYVLGVVRVLGQVASPQQFQGFDALIDSDIPVGVGVSSSHALECATAIALVESWQLHISRLDLIALTQRVEHEVVGSPTGTLDQSAILLGQEDHGVLLDFGAHPASPQLVPLGFHEAGIGVLVIDSTQRHHHATGGYKERRAECETAAQICNVDFLADLSLDDLEQARTQLSDTQFRRARHVVTETERARHAGELVAAGQLAELGTLLTASHASQRDDYDCSTPAIDAAVAAAVAAGAMGARLTGGGFGGASIALVPLSEVERISSEIEQSVVDAGHPRPVIFPVVPSAGAQRD